MLPVPLGVYRPCRDELDGDSDVSHGVSQLVMVLVGRDSLMWSTEVSSTEVSSTEVSSTEVSSSSVSTTGSLVQPCSLSSSL